MDTLPGGCPAPERTADGRPVPCGHPLPCPLHPSLAAMAEQFYRTMSAGRTSHTYPTWEELEVEDREDVERGLRAVLPQVAWIEPSRPPAGRTREAVWAALCDLDRFVPNRGMEAEVAWQEAKRAVLVAALAECGAGTAEP